MLPTAFPKIIRRFLIAENQAGRGRSLLLTLSLFSSVVLTACGNATPTTAPSAPNTPAVTTATTSTETVTLTFGWWANSPEKNKAFREWLDQFERSHPNIKIKAEFPEWTNYWEKLSLDTKAGTAYDIIGLCTCQAAPLFDAKMLLDLKQFSDLSQVNANLTPEPVKLFNWNNAQYGLPLGIALAVLGYNKDVFKAAGVTPPDPVKPMTFEAFKSMSKKLVKIENGAVTQYALHPTSGRMGWHTWVSMRGEEAFDNPVNPTKVTINNPAGIQGLTDYLSLIQEKIAVPQDEWTRNVWGDGGVASLETGKVAMSELGPWDFSNVESKNLPVGVAPFPVSKEAAIRTTANGLGIFKSTKYPKEAWEFLKWALETPNQLNFAKFSDVPVNKKALEQMDSVVKPRDFVPTLLTQLTALKPYLMSTRVDLESTMDSIVKNMERGVLTPAQAAAEMEQRGNAILAKK